MQDNSTLIAFIAVGVVIALGALAWSMAESEMQSEAPSVTSGPTLVEPPVPPATLAPTGPEPAPTPTTPLTAPSSTEPLPPVPSGQ